MYKLLNESKETPTGMIAWNKNMILIKMSGNVYLMNLLEYYKRHNNAMVPNQNKS